MNATSEPNKIPIKLNIVAIPGPKRNVPTIVVTIAGSGINVTCKN